MIFFLKQMSLFIVKSFLTIIMFILLTNNNAIIESKTIKLYSGS